LTAGETPRDYFGPIWQGLPQWPYIQQDLLAAQHFRLKERMPLKRAYSFTGDLRIYETCPRQYQFFRDYDFTPSRSAVIFFGLLVHQTIEELHRIAMDGRLDTLTPSRIEELFERTFRFLCQSDVRPIGGKAKDSALLQVMNYFHQNQEEMRRVIQTEVDVSLEKEGYIISGKVDLLLGGDGRLELLDFKTAPRPRENPKLLASYERQLCTYAHILENRHQRHVDRLLLYWTSEPRKEDAMLSLPYDPGRVEEAGRYFDAIVSRIQAKRYSISEAPEPGICKECDLRSFCEADGIQGTG
jgi:DNA helicase-2/ATP-dependent DNA helicase PcrA